MEPFLCSEKELQNGEEFRISGLRIFFFLFTDCMHGGLRIEWTD